MKISLPVLLAAAVAACTACTAAVDRGADADDADSESTSQGKTITPRGAPYGLQVELPAGAAVGYDSYGASIEARFIAKGAPRDTQASWLQLAFGKVSWVTNAEGCLSVRTRAGTTEDCNVKMAASTTLVIKLASLGDMFDGEVLGRPDVRVDAVGAGRSGGLSMNAYGDKLVVPGEYAVKLGADSYPVSIPAGAQGWSGKLVPKGAMNVVVTPPTDPAAFASHGQSGRAVTVWSSAGATYIAPGRGKLYVMPLPTGASTATLGCFGDTVETRAIAGTWTIPLYRLDVDDVETTGGAKVPGTFVIYRKQANGQWIALADSYGSYGGGATSPTKRGLDLPAGDYKVVTTYTLAGAPQAPIEDVVALP